MRAHLLSTDIDREPAGITEFIRSTQVSKLLVVQGNTGAGCVGYLGVNAAPASWSGLGNGS